MVGEIIPECRATSVGISKHGMTGDDSYGHAEKTRSPFREYSGFPGEEQDRQWQQQIERKAIKATDERVLERHQGWRAHHWQALCNSVQPIAVLNIDLQVDPQHDQDRGSQQHETEERHRPGARYVQLFAAAQEGA